MLQAVRVYCEKLEEAKRHRFAPQSHKHVESSLRQLIQCDLCERRVHKIESLLVLPSNTCSSLTLARATEPRKKMNSEFSGNELACIYILA